MTGILIGLDVGTGGTRALAVDAESGAPLGQASAPHELLRPRPGWTEQRPQEWARAARIALAELVGGLDGEVLGLGLAGQMHGSVLLDAADEVVRPALLWNDGRTEAACAAITERVGAEALVRATGNRALPGFTAPKLVWLREHEPEAFARVAHLLLPKDFVRLDLTGERATDRSDASGMLLLDVAARDWSTTVLDALELPAEWLPRLCDGTEATGGLREPVAGLPAGLPVAAGGGDNAAAAVGTGVVTGELLASLGTSGVLFAPTDAFAFDPQARLHSFCHTLPERWHQMTVTLSAAASLDWWAQTAGATAAELADEAAGVESGGLLFLPYLGGERTPHVDPRARGAFVGLTAAHGRAEMTRAVLEGVAFSLRDGLDLMRELGVGVDLVRATGGGARSAAWRQILADVLGAPVRRPVADEGPAYGATLLAGVAAGVYGSAAEATERVRLRDGADEPDAARAARYDELHAVYAELYGRLRDPMHALGAQA